MKKVLVFLCLTIFLTSCWVDENGELHFGNREIDPITQREIDLSLIHISEPTRPY